MAEKAKKQTENEAEQELCRSKMAGLKLEMDARQEELDALQEEYASLSTVLSQDETKVESFKDEIFEQIRIGTEAKGEISKREAMQEQFLARKAQLPGRKGAYGKQTASICGAFAGIWRSRRMTERSRFAIWSRN
jgi:hypothetical protein